MVDPVILLVFHRDVRMNEWIVICATFKFYVSSACRVQFPHSPWDRSRSCMSLILATVFPRSRPKSLKHQLFFCRFLFIQGSEGKAVVTSTYRLAQLVTLEKSFRIKESCLVERESGENRMHNPLFFHTLDTTHSDRDFARIITHRGDKSRVLSFNFSLLTRNFTLQLKCLLFHTHFIVQQTFFEEILLDWLWLEQGI